MREWRNVSLERKLKKKSKDEEKRNQERRGEGGFKKEKRKLRGRVKRAVVRGKSMLKKGRGAKNCKKEAEEGRRT